MEKRLKDYEKDIQYWQGEIGGFEGGHIPEDLMEFFRLRLVPLKFGQSYMEEEDDSVKSEMKEMTVSACVSVLEELRDFCGELAGLGVSRGWGELDFYFEINKGHTIRVNPEGISVKGRGASFKAVNIKEFLEKADPFSLLCDIAQTFHLVWEQAILGKEAVFSRIKIIESFLDMDTPSEEIVSGEILGKILPFLKRDTSIFDADTGGDVTGAHQDPDKIDGQKNYRIKY